MLWLQKYEGYGSRRDRLLEAGLTWFKLDKLTWLPRSRPRRTSRCCSFDFRGHAEGSPCSKDSLWLSLLQGSSDFSLVSKVPQVKNRLFPTNHLPLCKPIRLPVRPRCLFSWEYLWKDSWGLPMRAKSSKQRCPALCLIDLSYNVKYHRSCRVGGCSGHLTASGSWHGFPGVDHEGRQDVAVSAKQPTFFEFKFEFAALVESMALLFFTVSSQN